MKVGLVQYLQAVRRAAYRPEMTSEEISLVPDNAELVKSLTTLAKNPLTLQPEDHAGFLELNESDMKLDDTVEEAAFYIRQFTFPSKVKALECIAGLTARKRQYAYIAARLEEGLDSRRGGSPG